MSVPMWCELCHANIKKLDGPKVHYQCGSTKDGLTGDFVYSKTCVETAAFNSAFTCPHCSKPEIVCLKKSVELYAKERNELHAEVSRLCSVK